MEDILCVGDTICLYTTDCYGFMYSSLSSTIHNHLAVGVRQDRVRPNLQDQHMISFEVCVANRYKLNKAFRKEEQKLAADPENLALRAKFQSAKEAATTETDDNEMEQKRQRGRKVLYGQVIQMRHLFTNKYIHVSTTKTSETESSNMAVELVPINAKHALFRIMPRYKVKAEGDVVQIDDQVVLESVKSPNAFLHISKTTLGSNSVYAHEHEVNLSVQHTGFTVFRKYKPSDGDEEKLKIGDVMRFFHKEMEAYLVAEGLFEDEVTEDVHFRMRPMDQTIPKTMFPSSSTITYWQIEYAEGPVTGGIVKWEQPVKLIHLNTRRYLTVTKNNKLELTKNHTDPRSIFKLHAIFKEGDTIYLESYCRIENVATGCWLHAFPDEYKSKQINGSEDAKSVTAYKWSTAELRMTGVIEEKQYDDAFTLQVVDEDLMQICNFMAGIVPVIQKVIKDKKNGITLNAKMTHDVVTAMSEVKSFMVVNTVPEKNRQKLLRNFRMVDNFVKLLQIPYRGSPDHHHLKTIFVEAYDVLYTYLMGNSRKNELYIAKYIDFFQTQFEIKEAQIGLNAAHMVMELIRDNRKIVDRITHAHIDKFIDLLRREFNYRYLDLLSVLCVCDGVSIADNQKYITEAWLMRGNRNVVFYTDLGQKIGKDPGVVYVSTNSGRTWMALSEFVNNADEEMYLFLEHQLELFGEVCHGQNDFSIRVITQELNYLTWEEGFTCMGDERLPDQLRAKYCKLITTMFVDIKDNEAVLDRVKLSYIYDEIDQYEDVVDRSHSLTYQYFPALSEYISTFLGKNSDMTASQIGNNMLVQQVLRLVQYLVSFGFYYKTEDIKKLLEPLMSLLDGRNDKPYPNIGGKDGEEILKHFRAVGRYQQSPETLAIVNAKCQALEVLNLFFDFILNQRLEKFIHLFKITHHAANQPQSFLSSKPELGELLYDTFSLYKHTSTTKHGLKKVYEIFDQTSFLKSYDLVDVLKDLSHYKYDNMIRMSMNLLNTYYSAFNDLFVSAIQTQVCITDRSVEVFTELQKLMPTMRLYAQAKMNEAQAKEMTDILLKLIDMCHLEPGEEESHFMNQSILYNHDVVNECFAILQQEVDATLLDDAQYSGQREVFKKTFMLLEAMARGNKLVQTRLFDRLDLLLSKTGAEQELAEAMTELFVGNTNTCMKITGAQVQKVMGIVSRTKETVPQFLDMLNAVVKVEELDLPIKRNQGFVMQYFMQFRGEVAFVIDQDEGARTKILMDNKHKHREYLVAMVDMLATCAEGENQFIESICQTILKIPELMRILNNQKIDDNLKCPFLRFLLWVYINSAGGMIESGAGDLPHDKDLWNYISSINGTLDSITYFAKDKPQVVKNLLKKRPPKASKEVNREVIIHGSLHYLFEAVMPFLQIFCSHNYEPEPEQFPKERAEIDKLAKNFKAFLEIVAPLICAEKQMKTLISCMTTILSASTLPVSEIEEFQERYGGEFVQDVRSDARKAYDEYYEYEEDINAQLNQFAVNMHNAYGGINTVKVQLGFDSDRDYSEIDGDEELPLGAEFQEHLSCFIDKSARTMEKKYALTTKLVQTLSISSSLTHLSEKEKIDQVELDRKCLQLLRGLLHNEIIKLPENWEAHSQEHFIQKQLQIIEQTQAALNCHDVVSSVLEHLSRPQDSIVREVLVFMSNLLYNGNEEVQHSIIDYFTGTREETFFFAIKGRMTLSAIATREKRHLYAMHQARLEEALQAAKALKQTLATGKIDAAAAMMARAKLGSTMNGFGSSLKIMNGASRMGSRISMKNGVGPPPPDGSPKISRAPSPNLPGASGLQSQRPNVKVGPAPAPEDQEIDEEELQELMEKEMSSDLEFKDDGYIELVLRILGLMCDNQYQVLQDYLREQPDNIKSCNLVAETTRFLDILYSNIDDKSMALTCQLFDTLVEFCSGNPKNQAVVFDNKICDHINYILRGGNFKNCSQMDIYGLKMSIALLIKSISEVNPPVLAEEDPLATLATEVMESLDEDVLMMTMTEAYQSVLKLDGASRSEKNDEDFGDLYDLTNNTGFAYFHIIRRKLDLEVALKKENIVKTVDHVFAWDYFDARTQSIEIVMNDTLQKIYFQVKDTKVLREEVKELFKYFVDRTTPSNKIRGFMDWSHDIIQDVKYQRKVYNNKLAKFLVNIWLPMNWSVLILSILICSFMSGTWRDPLLDDNVSSDVNSTVPRFSIDSQYYYYFLYSVGGIHNFLCLMIYITFLLSNNPTFPPYSMFKELIGKSEKKDRELKAWHERKTEPSHLEVHIYSFKALYYMVFLACSVLGTIFYGYFFAFHLLHLAELNQLLKRVIQAVTTNGKSLALVGLMGVAILFIYSLVAFAFLRETYLKEESGRHCRNLGQCFITMLHHGFVDVPYTTIEAEMNSKFNEVLMVTAFDFTFMIIVTTIGLNIIFGIIVDTFSQLRDNKWEIDKDMQNNCFICSNESYDFERQGGGFRDHVKKDHNQWSYLFFFLHLDETRPNDYTALELYVYNLLNKTRYEFFPLGRSLSLEGVEMDQERKMEIVKNNVSLLLQKIEDQQLFISFIVNKMKEEEILKEKEKVKKEQQEWEKIPKIQISREPTTAGQ